MSTLIIIDTKENPIKLSVVRPANSKTNNEVIFVTDALIGRNGTTYTKKEGDGKTPLGIFELGIVFGKHHRKDIVLDESMKYVKINNNLYWVDDINSKYYNQLVDITKVNAHWNSAEHLIEYIIQYEYAIEIKTNPKNIPGNGSAIFIHCSNGKETAGCIAIEKEKMIELLSKIDKKTKVIVK